MSIRDYDQVLALWESAPGVHVGPSDDREGIRRYLRRNPGMSLVAKEGRRVVGAILCGHDGRRGVLHHLAVADSHRRRGIGRALVERGLKCLKKAGIRRSFIFVLSSNKGALAFWKKLGLKTYDGVLCMGINLA